MNLEVIAYKSIVMYEYLSNRDDKVSHLAVQHQRHSISPCIDGNSSVKSEFLSIGD